MSLSQLSAPLTRDQAYALVDAVMARDDLALNASAHEDEDTGAWVFEATCDSPPDLDAFAALAREALGGALDFAVEPVDPSINWVAKSLEGLKPVVAGGFYIYGSHEAAPVPAGLTGIRIGIGLSTGEALVGNMGLESRFDYSAIGDTVNVASRVEGESKVIGFDIVASDGTRQAVPDFAWLEGGSVQLKGKSRRLPIHILVGDATLAQHPSFVELRAAHSTWLAGGGDLARCVTLAAAVDRRLARFYELVSGRADDFASPA